MGSKWTEVRNDYFNEEELCYYIDAWQTNDGDEEGTVIAKVYEDGKIGTVYFDEEAKTDKYAQEKIDEIIMMLEGKS